MKIKETIERECCQPKDLKRYYGPRPGIERFCLYCGSHFIEVRVPDGAGGMENILINADNSKEVNKIKQVKKDKSIKAE
jgi:hypothetical protein